MYSLFLALFQKKFTATARIIEGARGVMDIVVENGHSDTSSNPGRDWLHFI